MLKLWNFDSLFLFVTKFSQNFLNTFEYSTFLFLQVLKKRTTQNLKKARLERNNKVRQTKGKRLRRQDRLRVRHSGANNNRKC